MLAKLTQLIDSDLGAALSRPTASRQALMIGSFNGMPVSDRRSFGPACASATMPGTWAAMMPAAKAQPCSRTLRRETVMVSLPEQRHWTLDSTGAIAADLWLPCGAMGGRDGLPG